LCINTYDLAKINQYQTGLFVSYSLKTQLHKSTFHFADDPDSRKLEQLLEKMETIDDDCSNRDISFVKTAEKEAIEAYGIAKLPSLVFFKQVYNVIKLFSFVTDNKAQ
jgi:hypothetical protein